MIMERQILVILFSLCAVELRQHGLIEDTGYPNGDFINSYLEYIELEFDEKKAFTADYFHDYLRGFQTEPTQAKSFGWETTDVGEVPFAALLISHKIKKRFCMGTVVTETHVVTPCACVRTMGMIGKQDKDLGTGKSKQELYYYDLGDGFDVMANHVQFVTQHVQTGSYPSGKKVEAGMCFKHCWNVAYKGYDDIRTKGKLQLYYPAVVEVSKQFILDVPCPWPPITMDYDRCVQDPKINLAGCYRSGSDETFGIISGYRYHPFDDTDLHLRDNNGRPAVSLYERQINVGVEFCEQYSCGFMEKNLNGLLWKLGKLQEILCWCDFPYPEDEVIFHRVRDEKIPFYYKSVHQGTIGSPVIVHGAWVGWTLQLLNATIKQGAIRGTWVRGIDDDIVRYLEEVVPFLKVKDRPKVDDKNRLKFLIHDLKDFVPDYDLKKEDVDLMSWAQIGNPRILGPKKRSKFSRASSIRSAIVSTSFGILLFHVLYSTFF